MPWAVFELTTWGEKEDTARLEKEIKNKLGDVGIFVPFLKGDQGLDLSLVNGYVFVEVTDIPTHKLFQLEDTKYIKILLTENQSVEGHTQRRISPVPNEYVFDLKNQFLAILTSNLKKNDSVVIRSGLYRNLPGKVMHVEKSTASVLIELRSLKILVDIPTYNLMKTKTANSR